MEPFGNHPQSIINPDGAAILDVERNRIVSLNPTGGYVWQRLQRGLTTAEIVQDLAHETGTDPSIVERDVCAFVQQLTEELLLKA